MDNKPLFVDEEEMLAVEQAKHDVESEKKEYETKPVKKGKIDRPLITTIILCLFVGYLFARTAYGFYLGFRYFDYAHGIKTNEVQK